MISVITAPTIFPVFSTAICDWPNPSNWYSAVSFFPMKAIAALRMALTKESMAAIPAIAAAPFNWVLVFSFILSPKSDWSVFWFSI